MPVKKSSEKSDAPMSVTAQPKKRTVSFTLPANIPLPKSWTPVLMVLLVIAVFLIGMLWTKVQYMSSNTAPTTAGTQGTAAQPSVAPGTPVNVANGNLPALGNKGSKVTVIEFADFQCPFCEQWFSQVWPSLKKDYVDTNKIAFYWRDYPFLGTESTDAANAARCANDQGKFWEYHDYLYTHQGQENTGAFSKDNLKKFAADMGGLNTDQFNNCVDSNKFAADASKDMSDGQKAGVNGTPTVFINGVAVVGAQPYAAFKSAIDAALAK